MARGRIEDGAVCGRRRRACRRNASRSLLRASPGGRSMRWNWRWNCATFIARRDKDSGGPISAVATTAKSPRPMRLSPAWAGRGRSNRSDRPCRQKAAPRTPPRRGQASKPQKSPAMWAERWRIRPDIERQESPAASPISPIIADPGMLVARILRAGIPHARIVSIDGVRRRGASRRSRRGDREGHPGAQRLRHR